MGQQACAYECGQVARYSSIVELGAGGGHRNWSYRRSSSTHRLSHDRAYAEIVELVEFGVKWLVGRQDVRM